jgi:hypothetical protein
MTQIGARPDIGLPWQVFAAEEPALASLGATLLDRYRMAYLATTTVNGAPRVHPVCPAIIEGRLLVGINPHTPKNADLRRDPRCVLHALPGEDDQEFFVRALATEPTDRHIRDLAAAPDGSGVLVNSEDVLYELLLCTAFTARYTVTVSADGRADYRADRSAWRAGRRQPPPAT